MTKAKRWLLSVLAALFAAALAVCVLCGIAASAAVYTAEEIFSFRGIVGYQGQSLDGSNAPAFAVTTGSGGEVLVNGELSGDFSWSVGSEGITAYQITVTDAESGDAFVYDARVSGSRVAVTLRYTGSGGGRELSSVTAQGGVQAEYCFSPAAAQAWVNDAQGTRQSFVIGGEISDFASYRVSLRVAAASAEGKLYIYSLCGYDCVTDNMYDSSEFSPSVYAKAETNAVVGGGYTLPVPYASVLGGERVSDIRVAVSLNGVQVAQGAYPSELSGYTFTSAGSADIAYTATAASGTRTVETIVISVLEEADVVNTFAPDGDCTDCTVGTDTELILPFVSNASTLNTSADAYNASLVTVAGSGGTPLTGWDKTVSERGQRVRFSDAGEYTVTFSDRSGLGNTLSYTVTVDDGQVGIDGIETEAFYESGTVYELQPANLYYKGESKAADVRAYAPDGTEYTSSVSFTMGGIYRIVYTAEFGGEQKSVELRLTVYERADGSFSCKTSTVEYVSLGSGNAGVLITSPTDEQVVYERVIDLSGASVETEYLTTEPNGDETFLHIKDKDPSNSYCLIDFNVVNSNASSLDYSRIYIRVTDVYDEENFFEIRILDGTFAGAGGMSYIRARATGQSFGGLEVRNGKYGQAGQEELGVTQDGYNESGGFLLNYGFQAQGTDPTRERSVAIYYDNTEKAIFAISGTQYCTLIYDFDDPRFSSSLWGGFTTGEAKISITLSNISTSASMLLYSVGGYDLSSEYMTDSEAPVLTLGAAAAVQTYAIVGKPFPVFEAFSSDKNWSHVTVRAYLGSEEVPVENGTFTPDRPAAYTLVYTAEDAFGNRSAPQYVTVRAQSAQPGITLTASGRETSAVLGREYARPAYEISGASGQVTEFFGYRLKGGGAFIPAEGKILFPSTGTYEVLYKVTDYLMQSAEDFYEVTVTAVDEPVVDTSFRFYPMMLAGGFAYEIYELPAYVWTDSGPEQAEETVRIYDGGELLAALQPGQTFAPSAELAGKTLTAQYTVAGTEQTYDYAFAVRAIEGTDKSAYFTPDANVTYSQANLSEGEDAYGTGARPVFAMEEDGGFSFDKELLAENFAVAFYFPYGAESVGTAVITLTDSRIPSESVSVTLRSRSGRLIASTDGVNWYDCTGTWSSVSSVMVVFAGNSGTFTDSIGASLGAPAVTTGGAPFTGFSSGRVTFRIDVTGVTAPVALCVTEINNQQMSMTTDRVAPELFIQGSYPGYDLGERVTVLPAIADDVLWQATPPTVSVYTGSDRSPVYVKDENGQELNNVPADKLYYFTASAYDTYKIVYTSRDTSSRENQRTEEISIVVQDKVAPELSLSQSVLSAKAGESTDLRALLTATDNITPADELQIVISVRKDRLRYYADENGAYTFTEAGRYYVDYLVQDGFSNLAIVTLTVDVQ